MVTIRLIFRSKISCIRCKFNQSSPISKGPKSNKRNLYNFAGELEPLFSLSLLSLELMDLFIFALALLAIIDSYLIYSIDVDTQSL